MFPIVLRAGVHGHEATWRAMVWLIGKRTRLVAAQRTFERDAHLLVDRREMLRIAHGLVEPVTKNVHDPQTLRQIIDELDSVVGEIRGNGAVH